MSLALAARAEARPEGAMVVGAEIVAGHDGAAELLVRLRHENGAEGPVVLDPATGFAIMDAAGVAGLDDLVGRRWLDLLREL
ncbi:MAG TPA: hypothetical protein VKQ54_07620 [Caulobacteraceae bacterium]|nr:hypothetical protein [Caulobacteraceae bacterium]